MPLTDKGKEIMANLVKEYGPEKGEQVFYAMKNEGKLSGVDSAERLRFYVAEQLSDRIGETPEGFLVCYDVPITRTGEFVYKAEEVPVSPDSSGMIRIKREDDEVFAADTILSFEGKPVTINHPEGFVNPENWQELAHGTIQNVRRGEGNQSDLLLADLLITTEDAINLVKAGLREVSCGYDAQYEELEAGLGKQADIIGNHVALVARGRAGSRCAIGDNKTCDGCGKCNCGKNSKKEDVPMTFKERLLKWVDSFPFKDEDLEKEDEDAKKKAAEEEAKKAADKKAKDQEEEEKKAEEAKAAEEAAKAEEEEKKKAADKKAKDQEGGEGDILARLSRLEELIAMLIESDKQVHEAMDKRMKDDEEEAKKAAEAEEQKKKEEEEEKEATADCAAQWPEISHRCEILFPGLDLKKPTRDHRSVMREIKVAALKGALTRDDVKKTVNAFLAGRRPDKLTADALDAVFIGASEVLANVNNSKVTRGAISTQDFDAATTIADINKKNKEYYKAQK